MTQKALTASCDRKTVVASFVRQGINAVYSEKEREKTMEQRKEAIICLEGLGKQFQTTNGTVTALDDINLEILQGEIFGIIGLSGAGKSTLVRCINYLETPTAGRVILRDRTCL